MFSWHVWMVFEEVWSRVKVLTADCGHARKLVVEVQIWGAIYFWNRIWLFSGILLWVYYGLYCICIHEVHSKVSSVRWISLLSENHSCLVWIVQFERWLTNILPRFWRKSVITGEVKDTLEIILFSYSIVWAGYFCNVLDGFFCSPKWEVASPLCIGICT